MDRTAHVPNARFEYRDLVIPLDLRLEGARYPSRRELAASHGSGGALIGHLEIAARAGWYPDEAADWDSLAAAGRFMTEAELCPGTAGEEAATPGSVTVYRSVTIRLKRISRRGLG